MINPKDISHPTGLREKSVFATKLADDQNSSRAPSGTRSISPGKWAVCLDFCTRVLVNHLMYKWLANAGTFSTFKAVMSHNAKCMQCSLDRCERGSRAESLLCLCQLRGKN